MSALKWAVSLAFSSFWRAWTLQLSWCWTGARSAASRSARSSLFPPTKGLAQPPCAPMPGLHPHYYAGLVPIAAQPPSFHCLGWLEVCGRTQLLCVAGSPADYPHVAPALSAPGMNGRIVAHISGWKDKIFTKVMKGERWILRNKLLFTLSAAVRVMTTSSSTCQWPSGWPAVSGWSTFFHMVKENQHRKGDAKLLRRDDFCPA